MERVTFQGCYAKTKRAKQHLRDLEVAVQGFFKTNPYEIAVDDNPQSGQREHRVIRSTELPRDLALIAGDTLHNLRSALDHLVWQLVIANGRNPEDHKTAFPIWRSKVAYEANRPGDANGISKDALDVLYALKPYEGGNDALWRIHKLDIVDKHRLLLTVASAHRNVIIDMGAQMRKESSNKPGFELMKSVPDMPIALIPEEQPIIAPGVVLFGAPLGDKAYDDVKFTIEITLNEPEIVVSDPLVPALQQLVSCTDEVISLFAPLIP